MYHALSAPTTQTPAPASRLINVTAVWVKEPLKVQNEVSQFKINQVYFHWEIWMKVRNSDRRQIKVKTPRLFQKINTYIRKIIR